MPAVLVTCSLSSFTLYRRSRAIRAVAAHSVRPRDALSTRTIRDRARVVRLRGPQMSVEIFLAVEELLARLAFVHLVSSWRPTLGSLSLDFITFRKINGRLGCRHQVRLGAHLCYNLSWVASGRRRVLVVRRKYNRGEA